MREQICSGAESGSNQGTEPGVGTASSPRWDSLTPCAQLAGPGVPGACEICPDHQLIGLMHGLGLISLCLFKKTHRISYGQPRAYGNMCPSPLVPRVHMSLHTSFILRLEVFLSRPGLSPEITEHISLLDVPKQGHWDAGSLRPIHCTAVPAV